MTRIDILRDLIKTRFDDSQAAFARAIHRAPAQVGQWLGGHRKLGDAGARNIELALNLPAGYFDNHGHMVSEPPAEYGNVLKLRRKERDPVTDEINQLLDSVTHADRVKALNVLTALFPHHAASKANKSK